MSRWKARIRAALGIGVTWGAAWFAAGMVLLAIIGPNAADVPFPLFFGLLGFLAGVAFSGILGVIGRNRRFEQMSFPAFAMWGAIGGVVLAAGVGLAAGQPSSIIGIGAIFAGAGALSATGTLALARRAERGSLGDADRPTPISRGSDDHERDLNR